MECIIKVRSSCAEALTENLGWLTGRDSALGGLWGVKTEIAERKGKSMTVYYLAVDIRGIQRQTHSRTSWGWTDGAGRGLSLPNRMKETHGHLCWDTDELFSPISKRKWSAVKSSESCQSSMGIDTWAVDYVFLDHGIGWSVIRWDTGTTGLQEWIQRCRKAHSEGRNCIQGPGYRNRSSTLNHPISLWRWKSRTGYLCKRQNPCWWFRISSIIAWPVWKNRSIPTLLRPS